MWRLLYNYCFLLLFNRHFLRELRLSNGGYWWLLELKYRRVVDFYLMPDEGAVEGGRGPEHELGLDAQLKQVSQVLVVGEFKGLREAEFNGVLAFLHLAFSQGQF